MSQTKKLALSATLTALGTVFMVLGGFIEVLDLTVCALASLLVAFVYIEIGAPYYWLVWICTSLCSALLFPGSPLWVEYLLVFGIWPILKAFVERLPRFSWWPVKLVFINAVIWALIFLVDRIFGTPFIEADLPIMKVVLYLLMNAAFIHYDLFITVMVRYYYAKIRNKIKTLLK